MKRPNFRSWFRVPDYAHYELVIIRALFALIIWDVMPRVITIPPEAEMSIDFRWLADPGVLNFCRWLLIPCLILYVAGCFLHFVLPVILILLVGAGAISASYGAATHSKQIVPLCVLAQCAWYVVAAIRGKSKKLGGIRDLETHRGGAFAAVQAIAAAYVISAISKIAGDGNWLADAVKNFQIQKTKNQRMKYYEALDEKTAETGADVQGLLHDLLAPILGTVEHLLLTSPIWRAFFLGGGFALELFAFLALVGRKFSLFIGASLIIFHLSVFEIMGLRFRYNIYMLLIFLVGIPYWIGLAARPVLGRGKARG